MQLFNFYETEMGSLHVFFGDLHFVLMNFAGFNLGKLARCALAVVKALSHDARVCF